MFALKKVFISFFECLNILMRFFHHKQCKNLHKLTPIASSGNLLFKTTVNEDIQNSVFFKYSDSLVVSHLLSGIVKRMSIIEHLM